MQIWDMPKNIRVQTGALLAPVQSPPHPAELPGATQAVAIHSSSVHPLCALLMTINHSTGSLYYLLFLASLRKEITSFNLKDLLCLSLGDIRNAAAASHLSRAEQRAPLPAGAARAAGRARMGNLRLPRDFYLLLGNHNWI